MQNISQDALRNLWMAVPPLEEQADIVQSTANSQRRFTQLTGSTEQSLSLLRERREAVIAAAVTGQLDVEVA